jgi:N-acetylglucosamine-6-sulfatase
LLKNAGLAPVDWRKAIYYSYSGEATHHVAAHDGVRNDRYKLFHLPKSKEWQLFDLEKDPREMKSVHDDPAYAPVLAEMKAVYQNLRTQYKVPGN